MRIFLNNYLGNRPDPVSINRLDGGISSSLFLVEKYAGVEPSELTEDEIDHLRPGVFRLCSQEGDPVLMKTHEAFRCLAGGEPLFPPEVTRGAVYLVRNPLDVVISAMKFYRIDAAEMVRWLGDPGWVLVGEGGVQSAQRTGCWSGHVRSWLDDSGPMPVLPVRYEDLLGNPESEFQKVIRFLGLPMEEERLRRAIRNSSIAELRKQETHGGFREATVDVPFFGKAVSGAWQGRLDPSLVERVVAEHGQVMDRFGYLEPVC